jgi:hypothetical protein
VTGTDDPSDDSSDEEPAWHERTSTLVGASVAAVAAIGLLWLVIAYASNAFTDPAPAPQYYPEPSASKSNAPTTTSGSTETITSTSPPVTTDINPGDTTTTSGTSPSSSSSPSSSIETTTSFDPSNLPRTKTSTGYDDGHRRPRFNETRTLYPRP